MQVFIRFAVLFCGVLIFSDKDALAIFILLCSSVIFGLGIISGPQKWFARVGLFAFLSIFILGQLSLEVGELNPVLLILSGLCLIVTSGYFISKKIMN